MDKGWAWLVLIACFFNQVLCDGLMQGLGVLLVVWQEQFPGSVTKLSWIISLIAGVSHTVGPIGNALCKTFSIRQVVMGGAILTSASFIAASFATNLWHLYATFALAGIGMGFTFQPCIVIITYYFNKRLGRANGVAYAGVAVGIFAFPPLFQVFVSNYGWQGALLITGSLEAHIGVCAVLYRSTPLEIANQKHTSSNSADNRNSHFKSVALKFLSSFDFHLCKNFHFCCLLAANFLTGVAHVIVIYYLALRAVEAGIPDLQAAFLVSIIGIGSLTSRVTHGYLIDYKIVSVTVLTAIAHLVCAISSALNPVTDKYAGLVTLSVLVGLSGGVFHSTVPVITTEYVGAQRVSGGVGLLLLMQGTGDIMGSYLTGVLVDATGSYDIPFYVAGACSLLCSLLIFAYPLIQWCQRNHGGSK